MCVSGLELVHERNLHGIWRRQKEAQPFFFCLTVKIQCRVPGTVAASMNVVSRSAGLPWWPRWSCTWVYISPGSSVHLGLCSWVGVPCGVVSIALASPADNPASLRLEVMRQTGRLLFILSPLLFFLLFFSTTVSASALRRAPTSDADNRVLCHITHAWDCFSGALTTITVCMYGQLGFRGTKMGAREIVTFFPEFKCQLEDISIIIQKELHSVLIFNQAEDSWLDILLSVLSCLNCV